METVMPRGLFENTQEIYAEIASYPVVPPEKIKQYWNAYTTTFRRLFDPSAFRLENFWWHVWGSDRLRNLSGPALARLFEEFSTGPTFVSLRSPPDPFTRSRAPRPGRPRIQDKEPSNSRSAHDGSGQEAGPSDGKMKPTPSSARPPPPHPILKKSRGPSSSGPRPTARFASPPASSDEAIHDGEVARSATSAPASDIPPPPLPSLKEQTQGGAPATVLPAPSAAPATGPTPPDPTPVVPEADVQSPAIPPPTRVARASTGIGRKVVANTAASRRRPTAVRRKSSHSSTGSESGPRVAGFVATSQRSGPKRSTPTASQLPGPSPLSSETSDFRVSEKAAGKRPAKTATRKQATAQNLPPAQANGPEDEPTVAPQMLPVGPQRRSTWDVRDSGAPRQVIAGSPDPLQRLRASPSQIGPPPVAGFVDDNRFRQRPAPMVRSLSTHSEGPRRMRELGVALLPSQATSSVATVTATARGQFDSETLPLAPIIPEEADDAPDGLLRGSQQPSSVLGQKFRPTPPNPAPPIPFGRSRSELTLLLKRGKPVDGEDNETKTKKTGI